MSKKKVCGIYCIENKVNNKKYIGQTINIKMRWRYHYNILKRGKHDNVHLQKSWDKHGEENFEFIVLEECHVDLLLERENYWMEFHKTLDSEYGYNKKSSDGKLNEEIKTKISESKKGSKASEESKTKMSNSHRKFNSEETRKKISNSQKGRVQSKETREKISKKAVGRKHTEESKEKMSKSRTGGKRSEETKAKMSKSAKGATRKHKTSTSKYYGVSYDKRSKKWMVITNKIYLGRFLDEIEAAKAYDEYIIKNNINKPLNFKGE